MISQWLRISVIRQQTYLEISCLSILEKDETPEYIPHAKNGNYKLLISSTLFKSIEKIPTSRYVYWYSFEIMKAIQVTTTCKIIPELEILNYLN